MNVLLIGSGGREHALAHKIKESPILTKLFILPGNPGTKKLGENVELDINDKGLILSFCRMNKIELVIIGPEKPLVDGVADVLRLNEIKVFGPSAAASAIEARKSFSKRLMRENNIPTAEYIEFNSSEYEKAKEYFAKSKYPCVIKADGLAAGKGVIICQNSTEALRTIEDIFISKIFGSSGNKIIVEEFMEGEEASIFAITDGEEFLCLPAAQDHKRIGDLDTGKNTGGMGAYSPAPIITESLLKEIESKIIAPTLKALVKEGRRFNGCLYAGIMITTEGAKVVEFNCRFGDPETQAVVPLLEGNFLSLLYSTASGKLDKSTVKYSGGSAVCVVASSVGYPSEYKTGFEIKGINDFNDENVIVFHAGTKEVDGKIVTSGGRVLGVTSILKEKNLKKAKETAYKALSHISFEGIYYRHDIADKAILKK